MDKLDIVKVAETLTRRFEMLDPLSSVSECCIYKVPPCLRESHKELYTPQVVSIGPFHHGKKEFELMEKHKHSYLYAFLDRVNIGIREYLEGFKELEKRLRQSYIGMTGFTREEFVEMMAVDGAFVIEYLLKYSNKSFEGYDRVFEWNEYVTMDLLLLENQLPFFYFKYLYGLVMKSGKDYRCLSGIVQEYLSNATAWEWPFDHVKIAVDGKIVHHLLHVLINCLLQSQAIERSEYKTIWEVDPARVKFKPSSATSSCLSTINFSKGILNIPKIPITYNTKMVFKNMEAFEKRGSEIGIWDYIFVMNMLNQDMDMFKQDVKVLQANTRTQKSYEWKVALKRLFSRCS